MLKYSLFTLTSALIIVSSSSALANPASTENFALEEALQALDAQLPGKLMNNPYKIQWSSHGSNKKEAIVKADGVPGQQAYRVKVTKSKRNFWETAIRIPMTKSIAKGDVILVSYWARAAKPQKGREFGDITVSLQRNVEPYDSVFEARVDLGTEWKLYNASGKAKRDYAANKTNLNFNLAHAKQTLEFGQFYIMNLGPNGDASKYMK